MKRIICLMLVLILTITSLSACKVNKEPEETLPEDNSIELTMDNYDDYLDVELKTYIREPFTTCDIMYCIDIKGASPNFNYIDVELIATLEGECVIEETGDVVPFEESLEINTDIGGKYYIDDDCPIKYNDSTLEKLHLHYGEKISCEFTITDVSGKVVPV